MPAGLLCAPELLERAGLDFCERLNSIPGTWNSALLTWWDQVHCHMLYSSCNCAQFKMCLRNKESNIRVRWFSVLGWFCGGFFSPQAEWYMFPPICCFCVCPNCFNCDSRASLEKCLLYQDSLAQDRGLWISPTHSKMLLFCQISSSAGKHHPDEQHKLHYWATLSSGLFSKL